MKRSEIIERYITFMSKHLEVVLPENASEYRMTEIIRRQHHRDVRYLIQQMEVYNGKRKKPV